MSAAVAIELTHTLSSTQLFNIYNERHQGSFRSFGDYVDAMHAPYNLVFEKQDTMYEFYFKSEAELVAWKLTWL